jgi:hypothetical protein
MYAIDLYGFLVISKSHSLLVVVKFILLLVLLASISSSFPSCGVDAAGVYRVVVVLLVAKK